MTATRVDAGQTSAAHALIADQEPAMLSAVQEYLRQPGFSDTGEGIEASARLTLDLVRQAGADAELVTTDGHPVVLGMFRCARPAAKTLILYGLYDLTPIGPDPWSVDPLSATIMPAAALGLDPSRGKVLVSRGAHNHRGPTLTALLALQAMREADGDLPCHVIVVIEGEEEIGSPNLGEFVAAHRDLLATASGAWLPCMYEAPDRTMTLFRGFKGAFWTELVCRGGDWGGTRDARHLWAGNSVWVDSPLTQVIRAVASLLDADDQLLLDGAESLHEELTEEDAADAAALVAELTDHPVAEDNLRRTLGVARLHGGRHLHELIDRFMFGLNLNVQGVVGGYDGPRYYSMLPGSARARLDLRYGHGVEAEQLQRLLRSHLDRRGFSQVNMENTTTYPPARTPATDPILEAARVTAARYGVATQTWPMYNGCCPASLFQQLGTGIGFSFAGLGQGDRPHAPDEFIHVDAIGRLAHFTIDYLHAWAAVTDGGKEER